MPAPSITLSYYLQNSLVSQACNVPLRPVPGSDAFRAYRRKIPFTNCVLSKQRHLGSDFLVTKTPCPKKHILRSLVFPPYNANNKPRKKQRNILFQFHTLIIFYSCTFKYVGICRLTTYVTRLTITVIHYHCLLKVGLLMVANRLLCAYFISRRTIRSCFRG